MNLNRAANFATELDKLTKRYEEVCSDDHELAEAYQVIEKGVDARLFDIRELKAVQDSIEKTCEVKATGRLNRVAR